MYKFVVYTGVPTCMNPRCQVETPYMGNEAVPHEAGPHNVHAVASTSTTKGLPYPPYQDMSVVPMLLLCYGLLYCVSTTNLKFIHRIYRSISMAVQGSNIIRTCTSLSPVIHKPHTTAHCSMTLTQTHTYMYMYIHIRYHLKIGNHLQLLPTIH